jgi:hypothetical protein
MKKKIETLKVVTAAPHFRRLCAAVLSISIIYYQFVSSLVNDGTKKKPVAGKQSTEKVLIVIFFVCFKQLSGGAGSTSMTGSRSWALCYRRVTTRTFISISNENQYHVLSIIQVARSFSYYGLSYQCDWFN